MSSSSLSAVWKTAVIVSVCGVNMAFAADSAITPHGNPEQFDRDGKHICGYSVMTDPERGGYRSIMHNTKDPADRDAIREENCKVMRKRAQEKGVPLDE